MGGVGFVIGLIGLLVLPFYILGAEVITHDLNSSSDPRLQPDQELANALADNNKKDSDVIVGYNEYELSIPYSQLSQDAIKSQIEPLEICTSKRCDHYIYKKRCTVIDNQCEYYLDIDTGCKKASVKCGDLIVDPAVPVMAGSQQTLEKLFSSNGIKPKKQQYFVQYLNYQNDDPEIIDVRKMCKRQDGATSDNCDCRITRMIFKEGKDNIFYYINNKGQFYYSERFVYWLLGTRSDCTSDFQIGDSDLTDLKEVFKSLKPYNYLSK